MSKIVSRKCMHCNQLHIVDNETIQVKGIPSGYFCGMQDVNYVEIKIKGQIAYWNNPNPSEPDYYLCTSCTLKALQAAIDKIKKRPLEL